MDCAQEAQARRLTSQRQAKYGAEQCDYRESSHCRTLMPKKFEFSWSSRGGGTIKALSEHASDEFDLASEYLSFDVVEPLTPTAH
jgi:hypothetical protein